MHSEYNNSKYSGKNFNHLHIIELYKILTKIKIIRFNIQRIKI